MKLKPHPSISQLHLIAGKRENCLSVILYSRSTSLTSPLLCMRITHYTTKSTRSIILLLLCSKGGREAQQIWSTYESRSDATVNCLVFQLSRKEKNWALAGKYAAAARLLLVSDLPCL